MGNYLYLQVKSSSLKNSNSTDFFIYIETKSKSKKVLMRKYRLFDLLAVGGSPMRLNLFDLGLLPMYLVFRENWVDLLIDLRALGHIIYRYRMVLKMVCVHIQVFDLRLRVKRWVLIKCVWRINRNMLFARGLDFDKIQMLRVL